MVSAETKNKMAAAKKQAEKKQNAKNKQGFFKSTIAELKKVHWPTKKDVVRYTGVVLVVVIVFGAVLFLLDTVLSAGLSVIVK